MTMAETELVIIGGGPAGLTAGLYAARSRIATLLIEKGITGGQAFTTEMIENYPGFPEGISGPMLTQKMREQSEKFGLSIRTGLTVDGIRCADSISVKCGAEVITSRSVIIASGAESRRLGIPGEAEFTGRGVSYCATCDGAFFADKPIAVVGGGDAAVEEALYLTRFASRIFVIHRRDELRATKILQERAMANDKIEFVWDSIPEKVVGDQIVSGIVVKNIKTEEATELSVNGVFIYIGTQPNTGFLPEEIDLDERRFVITDSRMQTSVPGIYAAGDVRSNALKQVIVASGEGALAAVSAEKYLEETK